MASTAKQSALWREFYRELKHVPRVENPDVFASFVYVEPPPPFNAVHVRGGPYFDLMAARGFNVQRIPAGTSDSSVELRGWHTFVYAPVNAEPMAEVFERIRSRGCIILDCHFPITRMEHVETGDGLEFLSVLEGREQMIDNLRAACAVTVPREEWAADLAEAIPADRIWLLPDIVRFADLNQFISKFQDLQAALIASGDRHLP